MTLSKTNVGYGLMGLGCITVFFCVAYTDHGFGELDVGYHIAMSYALLLVGVGGVMTDSKAAMAFGSLALIGEAFVVTTYIMRLGMTGTL